MPIQKPLVNAQGKTSQLPVNDIITGFEHPQYFKSGRPFSAAKCGIANSGTALNANRLTAIPLWISREVVIVSTRMEVTTPLASAQYRIGLYTDNGSRYPGSLIVNSDSAVIDCSAVGVKLHTYASPITLTPGLYWQAFNNSIGASVRAILPESLGADFGYPITMGSNSALCVVSIGEVFTSLPLVFTTGATLQSNTPGLLCLYMVQ